MYTLLESIKFWLIRGSQPITLNISTPTLYKIEGRFFYFAFVAELSIYQFLNRPVDYKDRCGIILTNTLFGANGTSKLTKTA